MQRHRRFVALVAVATAVFAAAWTGLFYAMFDTRTRETEGRCSASAFKKAIAENFPSPKMVIIAGSSSVGGINAEMISKATGLPTLNMGLFAALGPQILLNEAKQTLKPGDTAMLALEYNAYTYDGPTAPAVDFILGCDRALFASLPLGEKARYVFGLDLKRVIDVLRSRQIHGSGAEDRMQRPEALSPYGDRRLEPRFFPPLAPAEQQRMALYQQTPILLNPDVAGVGAIRDFVSWAKANRITVLATWPNTIYFPSYESDPGFARIAAFYASLGVPMIGDPSISWLPREFFYDTQYHLNIEGILLRTDRLIQALRAVQPGQPMEPVVP